MDQGQAVIPPPPDGSEIVYTKKKNTIPPPPDGSGVVLANQPNAPAAPPPPPPSEYGMEGFKNAYHPIPTSFAEAKGAVKALAHPMADSPRVMDRAVEHWNKGEYGSGILQGIMGATPLIGGMASDMSESVHEKKYAKAAGEMASFATQAALAEAVPPIARGINKAIPKAIGKAGRGLANVGDKLYDSAMPKTAKRIGESGPELLARRAEAKAAGLKHDVKMNRAGGEHVAAELEKRGRNISDINAKAGDEQIISPGSAVKASREVEGRQAFRKDREAVAQQREDMLSELRPEDNPTGAIRNMTMDQGQRMKTGLDNKVSAGRANVFDPQRSASAASNNSMARAITKEMVDRYPELKPEYEAFGELKDIEPYAAKSLNGGKGKPKFNTINPVKLLHNVIATPAVKSQLALKLYKTGKYLSAAEAKESVTAWASELHKSSKLGQSGDAGFIEYRGKIDKTAPMYKEGPAPPDIPTSRGQVHSIAAVLMKDGNISTPAELNAAGIKAIGPRWNTATAIDKKSVSGIKDTIIPVDEKMMAEARNVQKLRDSRADIGEVPSTEAFQGRTAKGRHLEKWYKEGILEWANEVGHENAMKMLDEMATASPQVPVQRAVTESLLARLNKKAGMTDWEARDLSFDEKTGKPVMKNGVQQDHFRRLTGIQNRDAVLDVMNGLKEPSGRKVGPFAEWGKQVLTGRAGEVPVIDTHALRSATGRRAKAPLSDSDFDYADYRHRVDADRLGLPLDEQQASNWTGRNMELAEAKRAGIETLEDTEKPPENTTSNYIDFIRQGEKEAKARFEAEHGAPGADDFDVAAMEAESAKTVDFPISKLSVSRSTLKATKGGKGQSTGPIEKAAIDRGDTTIKATVKTGYHDYATPLDPYKPKPYSHKPTLARAAADMESPKGGFTIAADGKEFTSGYSYSPYKNHETIFRRPITSKDIAQFASDKADILGNEGHNIGGYKDGRNRYLDVAIHSHNIVEATQGGIKAFQKALYDHKNHSNIELPERSIASVVRLKDGSVIESPLVDANRAGQGRSNQLESHLNVLQKAKVRPEDVADTGFRHIDREKRSDTYEWGAGGGTVKDTSFTLGDYEAKKAKE